MSAAAEILQRAARYRQAGQLVEAVACYREAVRLDPERAEAHTALAAILYAQKRYREAEALCRQAIRLQPGSAAAQSNLAAVLIKLGRPAEAESAAGEALRLDPRNAGAYNNLGNALQEQDRLAEAETCLRAGLAVCPHRHELMVSLGDTLRLQLRLQEARQWYETALHQDPQNAAARMNRALVLLLAGEWETGWTEYEWRWQTGESVARSFVQPLWDGAPLHGRRILLYAEQGLGDVLQFVRYAALVQRRGGTVIVECPASLARLLETAPGVDVAVELGSALPAFDLQAPLCSLPRIFRTTPESVPACAPYLSVNPERAEAWRARHGSVSGLKVGIAWAGNPRNRSDRRRSLPPELLARLGALSGVTMFALHPGTAPVGIRDLDDDFRTIEDTAAMISELDLVIAVDTMAAHLAGALAKPVWLLLPFLPDFRWLLDREETPWYPTTRLFRQPRPGDWPAVVDRVAAALQNYGYDR